MTSGTDPVLLGDQQVEATLDNDSPGSAEAFPSTGQITGTAQSINVYVASENRATKLIAGVYTNSNGHPGSLLASGSLSSPKGGSWNSVSISGTNVTAGTQYWIAVLGKGGFIYFRDRASGPCQSVNSRQSGLSSLPSSWSDGAWWSTCPVSAYVGGVATTATQPPPPTTTTTTTTTPPPPPTTTTTTTSTPTTTTTTPTTSTTSTTPTTSTTSTTSTTTTTTTTSAPPPPPPPPSNTATPQISGTTTAGKTLSATTGTWNGSPTTYTYQWEDCNTSGAGCSNVSGANSNTYTLSSGDVGDTIRVAVTAKNANGSSSPATSNQTATVAPDPPAAPTNSAVPQISGTTTQGQTLSTTNGSWTGSPTSYTYQWEDCNASGSSCSGISGATSTSYTLTSGDVAATIRVSVTANNAGGSSTPAASAQTATVAASGAQSTHCFSSPGSCGYPDPKAGNVGAASPCSSYPSSGGITTSSNGQVIQNQTFTGQVLIQNSNVTLKNVCVLMNGGGQWSTAIQVESGSNVTISNTTVGGLNNSNQSIDWAIENAGNSGLTLTSDYVYNCGECLHDGPFNVSDSYVINNGMWGTSEHLEDVYCNNTTLTATHDTFMEPNESDGVSPVAAIFCNTNNGSGGACSNHITLTNSLLAGADYTLYTCGNASSVGSSTMSVTNNRFARCTGGSCPDTNGYWPNGGQGGMDLDTYCPPTSGQTWSGNVWDDNTAAAGG